MALANAQGHVSLNGQSYVLIEESYEKRAQQPFSARFATGDPSTGDLSFWQFLTQKGWTGEGQEKFDVVTKYRQSAGWDMRDGKARLGRGIEAVTLTNALPAIATATGIATYDDCEGAAIQTLWELTTLSGANYYPPGYHTYGGSARGAISGHQLISGTFTETPASTSNGSYVTGGNNMSLYAAIHAAANLPTVSTWEFDIYTATSALNVKHVRYLFFGAAAGGGYIFEASGSNMTTWKLIKTTGASPTVESGDTTVFTCAGVTGGTATAITVKITRDASGNFEIFEGGVSRGTGTDLTYTTNNQISFSTYRSASNGTVNTFIDNIKWIMPQPAGGGISGKFVNYYDSLYIPWDTSGTAFTFTILRNASQASNLPKITHVDAVDIAVWNRDGSPTSNVNTYLVACNGTTVRVYNGETQVSTELSTVYGDCVIPINSTTFAILGTITTAGSGIPAIEIWKWTAETHTVATKVVLQLDGATRGSVVSSAALDSNGALYFATQDLSATLGMNPSRLFYVSSTDLLATLPTITKQYVLTDFSARHVFSQQGVVHLAGARRRGTESFAAIMKVDGTTVYESTKAIDLSDVSAAANFFNHGIASIWKNLDHVLFLSNTDLGLWDPVLQLDSSSNIREAACFNSGQFGTNNNNVIAIAEWNGQFFCLNAKAGTIKRTAQSRGALGADFSYCVLEMSKAGANTDLINKTLYSVTVELSAVVPSGETLSVLVNDTVVGTMVNADGVRKEIVLASELTAAAFTVKLRWPQASTWAGYISSGPLLKYVPTQFKKRAWGFGIRATKRLKYGDGTHESRTPTTMFSDIEAAWASNIPVTFIDVDGTSYSVLVTDFKQKRPLLQMNRSSEQEAFYFVELLQV